MFLLIAIVLLLVLPSPWAMIASLVCLALFAGEIAFWHRRVRHRRVGVGAETMIGARATAVTACRPNGQVRVQGEIWEARCPEGADPGDEVVVTALENLELVVERATST